MEQEKGKELKGISFEELVNKFNNYIELISHTENKIENPKYYSESINGYDKIHLDNLCNKLIEVEKEMELRPEIIDFDFKDSINLKKGIKNG